MTARLDPDALEAAAKAIDAQYVVIGEKYDIDMQMDWTPEAHTAITAYIAAIEPKLRERVDALIVDANTLGIRRQRGDAAYLIQAASNQRSDTRAALFALFGLEPNE